MPDQIRERSNPEYLISFVFLGLIKQNHFTASCMYLKNILPLLEVFLFKG
jgi:hypothetical protein